MNVTFDKYHGLGNDYLVYEIGKHSETAACFPKRINTQIVKVLDRKNIQIEIYERGAGYTPPEAAAVPPPQRSGHWALQKRRLPYICRAEP